MGAPFSSPEAEVAALRAENARLRRLLDLTPEQARPPAATQTGLFLDRPGPVTASSSGPDKVRFFRTLVRRPHRRVRDQMGERADGPFGVVACGRGRVAEGHRTGPICA